MKNIAIDISNIQYSTILPKDLVIYLKDFINSNQTNNFYIFIDGDEPKSAIHIRNLIEQETFISSSNVQSIHCFFKDRNLEKSFVNELNDKIMNLLLRHHSIDVYYQAIFDVQIKLQKVSISHSKENTDYSSLREDFIQYVSSLNISDSELLKDIVLSFTETIYEIEKNTIYIDITETMRSNLNTGIQRVARELSKNMLNLKSTYDVCICYCQNDQDPFYKKDITNDYKMTYKDDEQITFKNGDILLFLDINFDLTLYHQKQMQYLMAQGVCIYSFLYDLIPINFSNTVVDGMRTNFENNYLKLIVNHSGVITDSKHVENDLVKYIHENQVPVENLKLSYNHLGADFKPATNRPLSAEHKKIIKKIDESPLSFLMVGTMEPRKDHSYAYKIFKEFNKNHPESMLIIAGSAGWKTEELIKQLKADPLFGKNIIWINNADDACLIELYKKTSALLCASMEEGFGLPLIEGAHYGISLIARDIEVFREVAGEHAYYFSNDSLKQAVMDLEEWYILYKENKHPKSTGMKCLTWQESANNLYDTITKNKWDKVLNTK